MLAHLTCYYSPLLMPRPIDADAPNAFKETPSIVLKLRVTLQYLK